MVTPSNYNRTEWVGRKPYPCLQIMVCLIIWSSVWIALATPVVVNPAKPSKTAEDARSVMEYLQSDLSLSVKDQRLPGQLGTSTVTDDTDRPDLHQANRLGKTRMRKNGDDSLKQQSVSMLSSYNTIRKKRWDFQMDGCHCRGYRMECMKDTICQLRHHSHSWKCQHSCCGFMCVRVRPRQTSSTEADVRQAESRKAGGSEEVGQNATMHGVEDDDASLEIAEIESKEAGSISSELRSPIKHAGNGAKDAGSSIEGAGSSSEDAGSSSETRTTNEYGDLFRHIVG